MFGCHSCGREVPDDACVCPYCAEPVPKGVSPPTITSPTPGPAARLDDVKTPASSSATIDDARFAPGTMLSERYRIVGMLGKGGMGEVYRADDLKLRQSVALKFLPEALTRNAQRLDRFHHEVRVARQVSHPNVCRVYDIAEAGGQHFISMEYVDGEDLASLLRRMGRPSAEKAVQIARQLCAGLAAAHNKGVLHRDLKPHNIMIDGNGRVRVTDFGLAGFAEDFTGAEIRAGTPAYMAPEQLAGKAVSVKSDLYALGLVLFELFTGQRMFRDADSDQVSRSRSSVLSSVTSVTSLTVDIDPAVERVILRCLEEDPSARPSSALAVAAALPGADPLAAALEAGEMPSPEMVANAGDVGGLRPAVAVPCVLAVIVGFVTFATVVTPNLLYRRVTLSQSPQDLSVRAQAVLKNFGYVEQARYRAFGFGVQREYLKHIEKSDQSPNRWDQLSVDARAGAFFWYRYSTSELDPKGFHAMRTTDSDPPQQHAGSATIRLTPLGKLAGLSIIPRAGIEDAEPKREFDWAAMLSEAGLDIETLVEVEPIKAPTVPCDSLRAWKQDGQGDSQAPIIIEAGTFRGMPTYFEMVGPWNAPKEAGEADKEGEAKLGAIVGTVFMLTVLLSAALLARRNLLLGRSDRRGALRLLLFITAGFLFASLLGGIDLRTVHLTDVVFSLIMGKPIGHALAHACFVWILYVALEPYVRRLWPETLVSWNRLLAGRLRDPLVGRDILFGGLFAVGFGVLSYIRQSITTWMGAPPSIPGGFALSGGQLLAAKQTLSYFVWAVSGTAFTPMVILVLLLVLRILLHRMWMVNAAFILILVSMTAVFELAAEERAALGEIGLRLLLTIVFTAGILVVLLRFGLLAAMISILLSGLGDGLPLTLDFSTWYAGATLITWVLMLGPIVYGFYISLAGRPLFRDELLNAPH